MAGYRGNQATIGFAKQTDKTTIPAAPEFVSPFAGGASSPTRDTDVFPETDTTRQAGNTFVRQTAASGSPELGVRDAYIHRILELALGAKSTNATGAPNYVHTLTPASVLPYATFYESLGGALYEEHQACKVNELTISADTGGVLTAAVDFVGRKSVRKTTEWTLPALQTGALYNFNDATVTLGGGATSLVGSFELTISNNVSLQQTDDSIPYDVVEGLFEVSLGFSLIFETLDEYNTFHYGTSSGTTQVSTVQTTSAVFDFAKGANNGLNFSLPSIAYEEFPVEPDTGGDPIVVDVRARAQRSGSPFVTAVVKNQAIS